MSRGGWKRTKRPTLTLAEVKLAVGAVQPHERAILLLAVFGQLRRGEIAGLQRRDVDVQNGTISIERTWTQSADGRLQLGPPKTDAGIRTITLPAIAMDELETHLDDFTAKEKDAWVFSSDGRPISPRTVDRVWTRVRDKVGRPEVRLHDLRHTGLTLVAQTGATTAELMFRGGHSSPAAALHYQQASKERDKAVAEALNRLAADDDGQE